MKKKNSIWMLTKSRIVTAVIIGIIFAITLVWGKRAERDIAVSLTDGVSYLYMILLGAIIACILLAVMSVCPAVIAKLRSWESRYRLLCAAANTKKLFWLSWLFLMLCWIPCLLAAYPGIVAYDCGMQTLWSVVLNVYNNHHPVLHTMIMDFFLTSGYRLFGNYDAGTLMYSVFQMLILSFSFAVLISYLQKRRVPMIIVLLTLFCFGVVPIHAMWSVCMTKDVLFTAFFVLFMVLFSDMVWGTGTQRGILFAAAAFLMCAFRNTGIYILVFTGVFAVAFLKGQRVRAALLFGSVILLWWAYTGPFFKALEIPQSDTKEALSVPIQQLSRVMTEQGDTLTEEEKEQISAYIPGWLGYNPRLSDPAKYSFDTKLMKEDTGQFIKLWGKLALRYPDIYLNSFLVNTYGFWYPGNQNGADKYYQNYLEYQNGYWDYTPVNIERKSKLPWLDSFYYGIGIEVSYQKLPGLGLLFNQGYCFWYLLLGIMLLISVRQYRYLLVCVPLIGLFGTLLLSPIALLRYAYPLMAVLPVLWIGICGLEYKVEERHSTSPDLNAHNVRR